MLKELLGGLENSLSRLMNGAPAEIISSIAQVRKEYAKDLVACTIPLASQDSSEHIIRISGIDRQLDCTTGSIYKYNTFIARGGKIKVICEAGQITSTLREMMDRFKEDICVRQVPFLFADQYFRTLNSTSYIARVKENYRYSRKISEIMAAAEQFDSQFAEFSEYKI